MYQRRLYIPKNTRQCARSHIIPQAQIIKNWYLQQSKNPWGSHKQHRIPHRTKLQSSPYVQDQKTALPKQNLSIKPRHHHKWDSHHEKVKNLQKNITIKILYLVTQLWVLSIKCWVGDDWDCEKSYDCFYQALPYIKIYARSIYKIVKLISTRPKNRGKKIPE